MAGSLNKVMLIGNLGRDPEIRAMASGARVANLSLATSEAWTDKQSGERREKTEWHRVVVFNEHLVDICERYLAKGRKLYVEGKLQTRKWTDQGGVERYSTEVVLHNWGSVLQILDRKPADDGGAEEGAGAEPARKPDSGYDMGKYRKPAGDLDDDIPF